MNTRLAGDIGEKIAVDYLEKEGYRILERNATYCDCEVDVICECYIDKNGNLIRQNAYNRFVLFVHRLLKIQPLVIGLIAFELKSSRRCDLLENIESFLCEFFDIIAVSDGIGI